MPTIIATNPLDPDPGAVASAVSALASGELVVIPTDTVYGVACRADDEQAVRALFAAKRRPLSKPLPLLLEDAGALDSVSSELPDGVRKLAKAFWPGPLTLVVRKSAVVSDLVTAGEATVGVRVPNLPLATAVLTACEFPVAVTSANISDEQPAVAVEELPVELLEAVAVVLDAGRCPGEVPSTVVDATTDPPRILRPGPVTAADIERAMLE
ncbi:MAG: L-threonylcarbamoyladenylate synthase [Armatimonadia bacterium]